MLRLLLVLAVLSASVEAGAQSPWETYLEEPTPSNAAKVTALEYKTTSDDHLWEDLMILETQVLAGDPAAFDLALRLKKDSDAHLSETLSIMLGRMIRINPRLFLEKVNSHRAEMNQSSLRAMVVMLGEEYVDREGTTKYEYRMRAEAIRGAANPDLQGVASEILGFLEASAPDQAEDAAFPRLRQRGA